MDGTRTSLVWHAAGMDEVPPGNGWLSPAEAARIDGMRYPKRRTEFRLGRWTAKTTLAGLLGLPSSEPALAAVEIRVAPDGAPAPYLNGAPARVDISMSDRGDWAVCLATAAPQRASVGCDLELVEPRSDLFVDDFLTPAEQREVRAAGADRDLVANLVWSAKESALKVLRTGLRRDTRSVEVTLDGAGRGVDGEWHRLHVRDLETGAGFPGWWQRFGEFVFTAAAAAPGPAPTALVDADRLRRAQPSHRWLDMR